MLYPVVEFEKIENINYVTSHINTILPFKYSDYDYIYTSLNRYERKKNIILALDSMKIVYDKYNNIAINDWYGYINILLVIAGGYDDRVLENVEYYKELVELAVEYGYNIIEYNDNGNDNSNNGNSSVNTSINSINSNNSSNNSNNNSNSNNTNNTNSTPNNTNKSKCTIHVIFRKSISTYERIGLLLNSTGMYTVCV